MKKAKSIVLIIFLLFYPTIGMAESVANDYSSQGKVSFYGQYIPDKQEEVKVQETSDIYQTIGKQLPATGDQSYLIYYIVSGLFLIITMELFRKRRKNQTST